MAKPRLPKSTIECPDCTKASGFPLGKSEGFSRRRFMQVAGTGLVASYFADVFSPRLLQAATTAPNVTLRNTAKNAIFIFLPGAPSNIDTWDLKEGAWTPSDFNPTSYDNNNVRFPQGLMPMTAAQLDKMAFVRSGLSWAAVHTLGQSWAQIARNPGGATGCDRAAHRRRRRARVADQTPADRRPSGLHRSELRRHSVLRLLPRVVCAVPGRAGSDRSSDDRASGRRDALLRPLVVPAVARRQPQQRRSRQSVARHERLLHAIEGADGRSEHQRSLQLHRRRAHEVRRHRRSAIR